MLSFIFSSHGGGSGPFIRSSGLQSSCQWESSRNRMAPRVLRYELRGGEPDDAPRPDPGFDRDSIMKSRDGPASFQDNSMRDAAPMASMDGNSMPPRDRLLRDNNAEAPNDPPSLQTQRLTPEERRDKELQLLFQEGFVKKEDLDERLMQFLFDVNPHTAAEVQILTTRACPDFHLSVDCKSSDR